jgi:hypothetical protein
MEIELDIKTLYFLRVSIFKGYLADEDDQEVDASE